MAEPQITLFGLVLHIVPIVLSSSFYLAIVVYRYIIHADKRIEPSNLCSMQGVRLLLLCD